MKKYFVLIITVVSLFISSCGNSDQNKKIEELDQLSSKAKEFNQGKPDYESVNAYLSAIEEYHIAYPEDTSNIKYLYDGAQYSLTIEKPDLCIKYLNMLIEKFGYVDGTSKALFLRAFVEENYIGNLVAAKASYQAFIENFPEEEKMVSDAKVAIENLGVPADEMLKKILEQNAQNQDSLGS